MARVGITFTDGTAFNLSSNARMVLNKFVYDPNGTSNSTLFSLTKGTFTFIARQGGHRRYEDRHSCRDHEVSRHHAHVGISGDGTARFANLIEENKAQVTEKLEQNKRGTPGKQRRAAQSSSGKQAESKNSTSTISFAWGVKPPSIVAIRRYAEATDTCL
jgi:hypothetical protein